MKFHSKPQFGRRIFRAKNLSRRALSAERDQVAVQTATERRPATQFKMPATEIKRKERRNKLKASFFPRHYPQMYARKLAIGSTQADASSGSNGEPGTEPWSRKDTCRLVCAVLT